MKPSQVSAELKRIASSIDKSGRPRSGLVNRDLRHVLAAMENEAIGAGSPFMLIHVWGDESGILAESTDITPPDGKYMDIGIPNSDDRLFVAHRDAYDDPNFIKEQFKEHLWEDALEHVSGGKADAVKAALGID